MEINGSIEEPVRLHGANHRSNEQRLRSGDAASPEVSKFDAKPSNAVTPQRRSTNIKTPPEGDLIICSGVKLKGEIATCNVLTVEGDVEGRIQARQLVINASGTFNGKAHVDQAEIAGRFRGTLEVQGKLIIRGTGRLDCQVSYGQLEIEPGGEMCGRMMKLSAGETAATNFWAQGNKPWRSA
jgi:cytoskeletal protein CcmA (bactofilin family)